MKPVNAKPVLPAIRISRKLWKCLLEINSESDRADANVAEEFDYLLQHERTDPQHKIGSLTFTYKRRRTTVLVVHSQFNIWVYPEGQFPSEEIRDKFEEICNKIGAA